MKLSQICPMTITLLGGPLDGRVFDRPDDPDDLPRTVTITYPCSEQRAHKNRYRLLTVERNGQMDYIYKHAEVEGCAWLADNR